MFWVVKKTAIHNWGNLSQLPEVSQSHRLEKSTWTWFTWRGDLPKRHLKRQNAFLVSPPLQVHVVSSSPFKFDCDTSQSHGLEGVIKSMWLCDTSQSHVTVTPHSHMWLCYFTVTWTCRNLIDAFYLKRYFSEFSHFCVTLLQCKPTVVVEQPQLFHPSIAHLKRLCPTTTQWLSWYYVLRWEFNRLFLKCSSLLIQAWFLPRFCHFKKSWLMHKAASQAGSKQSKKKAWRCQSPGCKP